MRRKSLYIPIITILATILTLLILLGISTLRNLHRDQVRMEEALVRDGLIVLRGIEASFRSGMSLTGGALEQLTRTKAANMTINTGFNTFIIPPKGCQCLAKQAEYIMIPRDFQEKLGKSRLPALTSLHKANPTLTTGKNYENRKSVLAGYSIDCQRDTNLGSNVQSPGIRV